ncbi:PepSY-associated TM helix domain-containing protein [Maribacter sp.]|uniref:PepSY-associated TM helix domain-containing protein n=1 Tax=Maribacter sp. TaxID=1897614 RepID=UPI0025C6BF04|nr:PepSY-associated TM helix domain-containing protein [Maribacter sp.]
MTLKVNKKLFFKIHSWIGIKLSILFFIVCFSGTLATLSHEMDWLFIPEIRAIPQKEVASRNHILENLKEEYPNGKVTYWMRSEEPYLCDIIYMDDGISGKTYVLANPYTGKIQGSANLTFQRFFRDLHYFLFIPFQIGNFTVLIFGFLLFISMVTALVFYKKWWKKLFKIQTGKGSLVFYRSLHRLVGLWSIPFTIVFSVTGMWYFMERANIGNLGSAVNPRYPDVNTPKNVDSVANISYSIDYDKAVAIAEQEILNFKVGSIAPSENRKDVIYLRGNSDVSLVRQRANRVYIDPNTYKVLKVQNANKISTLMWFNDIADPLHFGYWGGLATKIIWFFAGLGISSLVLSGIWITLKRKRIKQKNEGTKVMGAWKYANWVFFAIILFFMYAIIITKYRASLKSVFIISIGWSIFIALGYYIFVYRLNKIISLREFRK